MVTKERDEIRDRLKEFEIIADDLANLKRLQQENDQLKRSLAAQVSPISHVSVPPKSVTKGADVADLLEDLGQSAPPDADVNALEEFLSSPTSNIDEDSLIAEASAEDAILANNSLEDESQLLDNKLKSDKTPEDLLSEFEKMLG